MLLSKLTRFPWKHNKTKIMAETAMTEEAKAPQQPTTTQHATPEVIATPQDLDPCNICGRTFLPLPLRKHYIVCQKNATRKRKVFNSLKQRVEGTDLEPFHKRSILGRPEVGGSTSAAVTPAVVRRRSDAHAHTVLAVQVKPSKWKEKHIELMNVIRAAKEMSNTSSGLTIAQKASVLSMSTGHERCPSCERAFGPKAFDRHVEWCKEHKSRVQKSPANVQVAQDRLDARIKYRVPPLNKPKRTTIKDKYASGNGTSVKTPETPTAPSPLMTKSTTSLETIQSGHKYRSATGVASTTALHSRSSFRLKDMAPRVIAGPRLTKGGADGDRYQTTPLMVRRGGHEAVVKGKPKKQQQLSKSPTPSLDCNPLLTAERQLMDLLDDDSHLFKSSNIIENSPRPHTTANTPKPTKKLTNKCTQSAKTQSKKSRSSPSDKKSIKNAENKSISDESSNRSSSRASVIEPPLSFDDAMQLDDFEFIENYINNAFDLESNSELITDDDKCNKNYLQSDYKYSDDSSIDPRLINENDNLDYPGSFTPSTLTPPLSDTETIGSYKGRKSMLEPLVLAQTEYAKEDDDVDLDALLRDIDTLGKRFPKSKFSPTPKDDLCSVSLHSSFGISGANSNASETDRLKKLSSLKRSISLLDPVVPKAKPLKNKQEVNDFFMEQDQKQQMAMKHDEIDSPSLEKKDELFSVDDDLYEEYKRYEEMYLQEREQKRLNAIAYSNEEDLSSKKSSDSAYGSLNRKPSKARSSRHAKLSPLEPLPYSPHVHHAPHLRFNRTDSASSSGSDMSNAAVIMPMAQLAPVPIPPTNITAPQSAINMSPKSVATNKRSISPPGKLKQLSPRQKQDKVDQRVSKFCHECGSKYPLNSAKFCVECGIKRLIL